MNSKVILPSNFVFSLNSDRPEVEAYSSDGEDKPVLTSTELVSSSTKPSEYSTDFGLGPTLTYLMGFLHALAFGIWSDVFIFVPTQELSFSTPTNIFRNRQTSVLSLKTF